MIKHNFTIQEILSSAWSKTKENYWFLFRIFLGALFLMAITHRTPLIGLVTSFIVGIAVIAVSLVIAHGAKPTFDDLTKSFKSYKITLNYIIASVLYGLIVSLGFIAFVLPGIYLAVRLSFYKFFVVEHENMSAIDSLKESMKITANNFWKLLGFMVVLIAINLIGIIPFYLGLLVTVPVSVVASAILYKRLVGHHSEHQHSA
ncbi:MAG: hypothetical protein WCT07_02785 [Candidatus Paceibacterota bacterium]|jgi:uncharacterized membrane protein